MDGSAAHIEWHRAALLRVLLGLFAVVGLVPGGAAVARLPRSVRASVRRVLLPAETATRRLVLYLAHRVVLSPSLGARAVKARRHKAVVQRKRAPLFRLYDTFKYFPEMADKRKRPAVGPGPRIWLFDGFDHLRNPPVPEKIERDPDDATRLCRRMQALHLALNAMPAQAMRLAREMAKRAKGPARNGKLSPMRLGPPPGSRRERTHEVDELLSVCHSMAVRDRGPPGER